MPAIIVLDQVGIPAGDPGFSRTDGLANGAAVTVTSSGGGATSLVRLLWVPPEDTTAVSSLVQTGPDEWQFTPTPSAYGSYRIELITDQGQPTEDHQIRIFGIRTPNEGLLIPAANEIADNEASLVNNTLVTIDRSEQNEPFGPFATGSSWGWWRAMAEMAMAIENGGGGGGGGPLFAFNGIDDSQFDTTPDTSGTPINPLLSVSGGAITVKMDVGSGVGSAATWWVTSDTIDWNLVRKIKFVITPTPGVNPTDMFFVGVAVAGDRALGTSIGYILDSSGFFRVGLGNGSSPGALLQSLPIVATQITCIEVDLSANSLGGTGLFPPNGVPQYVGTAEIVGLTPEPPVKNSIFANPLVGYAGPDWGPAVPIQFGINLQAPAGVVDPVGIAANIAAFAIYGD